jgi:hypothetical protein
MEEILKKLSAPLSYKWKIQSFNKEQTRGSCVAYIDARDVMNRLDEVVGLNWEDKYFTVGDKLFCSITIKVDDKEITRTDTGVESTAEKEKGQVSDAFKRAAVKFGIGRFLYDLDIRWVNVKQKKPVDAKGEIIWDLTKYFQELDKSGSKSGDINSSNTPKSSLTPDINPEDTKPSKTPESNDKTSKEDKALEEARDNAIANCLMIGKTAEECKVVAAKAFKKEKFEDLTIPELGGFVNKLKKQYPEKFDKTSQMDGKLKVFLDYIDGSQTSEQLNLRGVDSKFREFHSHELVMKAIASKRNELILEDK